MQKQKVVYKWIDVLQNNEINEPFIKGKLIQSITTDKNLTKLKIQTQNGKILQMNPQNCYDYTSQQRDFDDMCMMSVLNQPQILHNIKQRFNKRQIFTYIGSTLLVVNPYQTIKQLFNAELIEKYKQITFNYGKSQNIETKPHIYLLAGKSYADMLKTNKKQTIIISGQSGAGKTQCTKFCLQLLTSLNSSTQHSIQQKILSCNPILQAFGNSKTLRNDNSSRFGKYIQIYFDQNKHIGGASIKSYLLEKSRVVELSQNERNYHCFYALVAGKLGIKAQPKNFNYLKKSNCYSIKNLNDQQNYLQICNAMRIIGFSEQEISRIWQILRCILEIGNLQIQDSQHEKDQARPCVFKNTQVLLSISKILGRKVDQLEKFLLYEKRKFLKQYLLTPYNSLACRSNLDSLSKQLYSRTFDFILNKINQKLKPSFSISDPKSNQFFPTINILDIFGFQNFQKNSFEQICINYTNEKLLNIYNRAIFQKQIQILKQDGLQKALDNISPPNNDNILEVLHYKKVSIFSIVNDLTPHQQFKDIDILLGIKKELNNPKITYAKNVPNSFIIKHSQCSVEYNIDGFKAKNKDKVKEQILSLSQKVFQISTNQVVKPNKTALTTQMNGYSVSNTHTSSKQSKTLLSKFTSQIQLLMTQLQSSTIHFVRCLKPNNQKKALSIDQKYLLNQIRYLGVFQTIKIRRSVFPGRKTYDEFKVAFNELMHNNMTISELLKKFDPKQNEFMLGKKRIYLSEFLQNSLYKVIQKIRKLKIQCVQRVLKQYRVYKFRKVVLKNLKTLKMKVKLLNKYSLKNYKVNLLIVFNKLKKNCVFQRENQKKSKENKLKLEGDNRQKVKKQLLRRRNQLIKQSLPQFVKILQKYKTISSTQNFKTAIQQIKRVSKQNILKPKQLKKSLQQKQNNQISQKQNQSTQQNQSQLQKQNYVSRSSYQTTKTIIQDDQQPYYNNNLSPSNRMNKQNKIFSFPKQFMNYNSVVRSEQTILFKYNLKVALFDSTTGMAKLKRLKQIVKKQGELGENKELADSIYINFKSTDLDKDTYNKIINFSQEDFSEKYMRKRSKIVGKSKNFNEIFVAKKKPLQKSLTKMAKQHQQYALKIFKQILKINQDGNQQFILKVVEIFLSLIVQTPQQIVNQTFLQLIKQIHTDKQEQSIKIYKLILAFLHFFTPDPEFIDVGLYLLFQKLECKLFTEKEESFLRLVFHKLYNKSRKRINTKYIPSKYQLYCLICKKLFPFNFYLSMGNCVQYNVESDQTFSDIKCSLLQKFGVNIQRINPKYFAFFQIVTFQEGQMQEIPISDDDLVWDVKSYWQIAINRYQQHKITPPKFYFLLKLKFPFQLQQFDYQGIELIYAECFFDYFTGKIRVPETYLMELANLIIQIKQINLQELSRNYIYGIFPLWAIRKYGDYTLLNSLRSYSQMNPHKSSQNGSINQNDQNSQYRMKFQFVKILQRFPLAMSIAIPPDSDLLTQSSLLYYLKPRRLYVVQKQNMQILQQFQLKKMLYWQIDQQKLSFEFKQQGTLKSKTHIFYTEYAQLFSDYLKQIGELTVDNSG